MKKTVSLFICLVMLASLAVFAFAEETDGDYIGMRFDLGENLPAGYVDLQLGLYEGALRLTTTVSNDAHAVFICDFDTSEYKYVAIMYRVTGDYCTPWFYMKDSSMANFAPTAGTYTAVGWEHDAEWHKAVYNIETAFPAMVNKHITGIRLPGGYLVGDTVDFKYICFFKTEQAANDFDGFPEEVTTPEPETTVEEVTDTETPGEMTEATVTEPETDPVTAPATEAEPTAGPADDGTPTVEEVTAKAETDPDAESGTESATAAAVSDKSDSGSGKLKLITIVFAVIIMLCAVALLVAYAFKSNVSKVFAAVIAIVLLVCSFAVIIAFALI